MDVALRKHCQTRKAAMEAERSPFMPRWAQVAEYLDPTRGIFSVGEDRTKAAKRSYAKVINSKGTKSLRTMTSGFMGGHTSKSRPWFRITVADPMLQQNTAVKAWCDDVAQAIRDVLAKSNFYTALPNFYTERHMFGVAAMACLEDTKEVVRFHTFTVGEYSIGLDHRQQVDSFHRSYAMTARQIDQAFTPKVGRDKLPQKVLQALDSNKGDQVFWLESLVEPNPDAKPGLRGSDERPFRMVDWVMGTDADAHGCLDLGGHYENPVLASRWDPVSGAVYGTSPAIDALGDIKQLQYEEGQKLKLIDKMADPALALPDYLRNKGVSTNPGERVYVTPMQTQQKVEPIYTPDPRSLGEVRAEIATISERIEGAFFVDLFQMLGFIDDRQRTAYEISERKEEKIAMLGPALESLTDEVLDPVIVRVYGIMQRSGLIPEPPAELDNVPVSIEYTSTLAQTQKAAGSGTIERTIGFIVQLAAAKQDPSVFDKLDTDEAIDVFADLTGSPARMIRSDEAVAAIRQGREQQAKMQQMAQMAPALKQGMDALKTASETVPQEGSVAANMASAMALA